MHRDHPGQGTTLTYTNATGRNDLVSAKVARDNDYLWFYVETADLLTAISDPKWMRLFIDIDRNKATGWEGYDFVINRLNPGTTATIEKSDNTWNWSKVGEAQYMVNGKTLVIKIGRSVLGVTNDKLLNFEFKWSDNMQEDGNIMDFYVNGDVAPAGRFNYHYFTDSTTVIPNITQSSFLIYPNPTKDIVYLTFPSATSSNSRVTIYSKSFIIHFVLTRLCLCHKFFKVKSYRLLLC